jgi:hypothetical protein
LHDLCCCVAGVGAGARAFTRAELDEIVAAAAATILHAASGDAFDAYVLSESSMFVYPWKLVLKTCGTTTLLHVIPVVRRLASAYGLVLDWVGHSHKNYTEPGAQRGAHADQGSEIRYFSGHFGGSAGALRARARARAPRALRLRCVVRSRSPPCRARPQRCWVPSRATTGSRTRRTSTSSRPRRAATGPCP